MHMLSNRRWLLMLMCVTFWQAQAQQLLIDRGGVRASLYKNSYALVIGVSDYTQWPPLPNIAKETILLKNTLIEQGFAVRYISNPTGEELQSAFRDFFADYGNDSENRLLIYFAGHGHTIGETGYLVPKDAPDPKSNENQFLRRAQSMSVLAASSREYRARHALYVFDSCFSGAIFSRRSAPMTSSVTDLEITRYLTGPASLPVRQFITAGTETQAVPEISQFTPLFIKAISGLVPSLSRNGYVTGKEIGYWLSINLPYYSSNQTPRSGTIFDARFEQGDIVFKPPLLIHQSDMSSTSRSLSLPNSTIAPAQRNSSKPILESNSSVKSSAPERRQQCFNFNDEQYCE